MYKTLVILTLIAVATLAVADTATQTDWSGGSGVSGPVIDWSSTFDTQNSTNWYSIAGELSLD